MRRIQFLIYSNFNSATRFTFYGTHFSFGTCIQSRSGLADFHSSGANTRNTDDPSKNIFSKFRCGRLSGANRIRPPMGVYQLQTMCNVQIYQHSGLDATSAGFYWSSWPLSTGSWLAWLVGSAKNASTMWKILLNELFDAYSVVSDVFKFNFACFYKRNERFSESNNNILSFLSDFRKTNFTFNQTLEIEKRHFSGNKAINLRTRARQQQREYFIWFELHSFAWRWNISLIYPLFHRLVELFRNSAQSVTQFESSGAENAWCPVHFVKNQRGKRSKILDNDA